MLSFTLKTDYIELKHLLKAAGLCDSGGQAGHVISDGKVKVDGMIEIRKGRKIRSGQRVEYQNQTVQVT